MKNIVFLILFTIPSLCLSQNLGVMTTDVNSRIKPGGEKLRIIKKDQIVEILQTKGSWSFVKDLSVNKKGWVSKKYIIKNIAFLNSDANSRSEPGGRKLRVINKGQLVAVLRTKGAWSFVLDTSVNKKGWVSNSLLSKTELTNQLSNNQNARPNSNNSNKKESKLKDVHPKCDYQISSPINGSSNASTNQIIKWSHGTGNPKGYFLTIAAKINDRLDYVETKDGKIIRQLNIGFVSSYSTPELKPYTTYIVGILPYNEIGLAFGCNQIFSFTTGSENTSLSFDEIIKSRLRQMKNPNTLLSRWNTFKSKKLKPIVMSKDQTDLFLREVLSYEGTPYKYGGRSRVGIDCSGLIDKGLRSAIYYNGERLNAQSWAQSGKLIANKNDLKPGDLVCFTNTTSSSRLVHHIAIYIGKNKFWHAPSTGSVVSEESLDNPYWKPRFIFGVRFSN